MAELTKKRDFSRVLAFHTQGKEIYWGFEHLEPPQSEVIVKEFSRVSGYKPVQTLASYAGYKDWFIQDWRRPGFTVELGEGMNPLAIVTISGNLSRIAWNFSRRIISVIIFNYLKRYIDIRKFTLFRNAC